MQTETAAPPMEPLLTLSQAFSFLPKRPSAEVLWRWRTRGVNGVKLKCHRVGHSWFVHASEVQRFIAAQTANSESDDATAGAPDDVNREEHTRRKLEAAGLLSARS